MTVRGMCLMVALWAGCAAQQAPSDPLAALTPAQKDTFQTASKDFAAERYADALASLKPLLALLPTGSPAQVLLAKYAAEAALNTGDRAYAFSLLRPIEAADAYDWQAKSLLARADAEAGDTAARDSELAALKKMYKEMPAAPIGKLNQILLERDPLPKGGKVLFWYSLEPWGRYKTYVYSRIFNPENQLILTVTLESSDFDQPSFLQQHPDLAAKGARRFSLDGYGPPKKNDAGQTVQSSHMTFGFFDGEPTFQLVRDRILKIAEGQASPVSRTDNNLNVPAKP